jgi:hypothetical protein
MNRPDLIQKYVEETGSCLELLDKMLDFTVTNLEVLKYVEWLEKREPIEENQPDYIQETVNNVIKLRFINELKSRMTSLELLNYDRYDKFLREIPEKDYSYVLSLMEKHTMEEIKYWWLNHGKVNG